VGPDSFVGYRSLTILAGSTLATGGRGTPVSRGGIGGPFATASADFSRALAAERAFHRAVPRGTRIVER
jgi:hypothetical protein